MLSVRSTPLCILIESKCISFPGGVVNRVLGWQGRAAQHFRGRPIFKDFWSIPYPFLWILGRQSLLNIPEIKFHFTLNAQSLHNMKVKLQPTTFHS